jgi:hypothetical protein
VNSYIFTVAVTILCGSAFLIQVGIYYNKLMTTEEKDTFDILPMIPYGIIGVWGLLVILKNGVVV